MKVLWTLLGVVLALVLAAPPIASWREARTRAAYPPLGQFVTVDGLKVHYRIEGTGPDLVLIHGSSGNMRDFTFSLTGKLASRYRVITFDRPGLGYSDPLPYPYGTIGAQAAHLHKAALALGVTKPIVLGQSYGGAVALAYALDYPADTAALVTVSAASHPWDTPLDPYYRATSSWFGQTVLAPMLTAYVPSSYVRAQLDPIFAPHHAPDGLASYIGAELALTRSAIRANAQQRAHLLDEIRAQSLRYGELTLPVEVLHGDQDQIVLASIHAAAMAKQAPGAILTMLPGVGHMPQHEAEAEVIAAIDRAAQRARLR